MESQKTINVPEKTFDNKYLLKRVNKKKNNKEIKVEKLILSFSFLIIFYCIKDGTSKDCKFH